MPWLVRLGRLSQLHVLSDGIPTREELARHRLIDNRNEWPALRVRAGQQPAAPQRHADRLQVSWTDGPVSDNDEIARRPGGAALDVEMDLRAPPADGQKGGRTGGGHAR